MTASAVARKVFGALLLRGGGEWFFGADGCGTWVVAMVPPAGEDQQAPDSAPGDATSISPTASAGSLGADEESKFGFLANKAAAKAKGSVLDRIKQLEKGGANAKQGGSGSTNTAPAAKKFLAPDRRKQVQPDEAKKQVQLPDAAPTVTEQEGSVLENTAAMSPTSSSAAPAPPAPSPDQLDNKQLPSEQPQEPPTTNTAIEDVGAALAAALSAKLELSDSAEELQPLAAAVSWREDQEQVPLTAPSRSDPVKVDSCPPPPPEISAEAVRASSESGAQTAGAAGGGGAFAGTSAEATAGAVCREGQQKDEEPKEAAESRQRNNDEDEQMSEVAAEGDAEEPPSKPEEESAVEGAEGAEVGQREQKEVEVENYTPSLDEQTTATREETAAAAVTGPVFKGESSTSPSGSEKSPAGLGGEEQMPDAVLEEQNGTLEAQKPEADNQMDVDEEEEPTIIPPDEAAAGEMPEASTPRRGLAEKEGAPVEGRGAATGSTTTAAEPAGAAEEPTQPYQKAKVSARVAFFEKFSSGSQKNSGK